MILQQILLAVFLVSCRAEDPSTYCRLSSKHTLCQFQGIGSKCDGTVSVRGVEDKNRQIILQTHNALRSIVASGQESRGRPGPQPQASNMQIMMWDEELAAVAQRHAEQCLFEHDCNECRKVGRFPVGQNLAIEWTTGPRMASSWKKMVTKWYEEVEEFPSTSARKYEFSILTGHYSQVIWADTNRVGCGFTSYRENGTLETNLYVCNYGPAGNFIGLPSYKVGAPCSQCPANMVCSSRFASLCEPVKKPSGTSSSESNSEEVNEIIPPSSSTEKPTKGTTTPVAVTQQRPTPTVITQRPTVTKPVAVTQQPTKPVAVTQRPMLSTLRPPFQATVGNTSTVQRDFVCQVGKGSCRAVFRGAPWIFRAQPSSSINPSYLETDVQAGELTELQINHNFPAPKANTHLCIGFQLRQEGDIDQDEESWLLPPLLIKIQPDNSLPVVVPVHSGMEGKWVQLKLTVSRIRTTFKLLFQQRGPTPTNEAALFSPSSASLRMALAEMRISNGSC